jgi:hypothetical protein
MGRIVRTARECSSEFVRVYTSTDIALLARVSEAYFHPNGRALVNICKDMYHVYGDVRFLRLAQLSVSHLYNLRKTTTYTNEVVVYEKTRPTATPIGERKKPYPEGKPGFIRVDSVHQGDLDKKKGVYHIHLVDEVTQWDITVTVEALSLFPFRILNFHSDNGSEYVNKTVAALLKKLHITQTKSRSRRTNDNALIEGKHAVTVRPVFGKVHIPHCHAERINAFNRTHLHDFVNFHRKCAFPTEETRPDGKISKTYKTEDFMTPCEKLCSLPNGAKYLVTGVSIAQLKKKATVQNHLDAAEVLQKARRKLFSEIRK